MAAEENAQERVKEEYRNFPKPKTIFLFSGKRKSGKDFITDNLYKRIEDKSVIIKISGPIKQHWAKSQGLDFDQLVGDGPYKEKYRQMMTKWGEDVRKKDYGYFCRAAIDMYRAYSKPIWIVSDIRRKTDIQWFRENFPDVCITVRIVSTDSIRAQRGWVFASGVDNAETECDLDDVKKWNLEIQNNGEDMEAILQRLINCIS